MLPLTQSFRFGPKVAAVANSLLWGFFGETTELIGSGPDTAVLRSGAAVGSGQHSILARSNSDLFSRAIIHAQANAKLGFVGGAASYNFSKIVDAWHLCANEHHLIRDQFIRDFPSFTELDEYARDAGDVELNRMVGLVHAYGQSIPNLIDLIHARSLGHLAQADVVLSAVIEPSSQRYQVDLLTPSSICRSRAANPHASPILRKMERAAPAVCAVLKSTSVCAGAFFTIIP